MASGSKQRIIVSMFPSELLPSIKAHDCYGVGLMRDDDGKIDDGTSLYWLARYDYHAAMGESNQLALPFEPFEKTSRMRGVHRVFIRPDKSAIEIINFDVFPIETNVSGLYIDETQLPDWVKRKLSALLFCNWEKSPTHDIDGVGRRIDEHTFWIYSYSSGTRIF